MIELVSDERCIDCDICVRVCPTNVFDAVPGGHPVIARQEDCQTCFMCELYCPADALFVAPEADEARAQREDDLIERGLLGGYRAAVGWTPGQAPGAARDQSFRLLSLGGPQQETRHGSTTRR
jgi:NAD-dependent dihydropyrimidine dehydrogenase PreA subunit